MNGKIGIRIALVLFVSASLGYLAYDTLFTSGTENAEEFSVPETGYVMYYFTQGKDCSTCDNIEAYALETLNAHFSKEVSSGVIEWAKVDTDNPENEHFNTDYNLYTKSIVLVEYADGEQVKWEHLEKVWDLVYEKPEYVAYVRSRTAEFMSTAQ